MNLYATFVHDRRSLARTFRGRTEWSRTAVECGGDGGSALASRLSENEHIGKRNHKIQNGSTLPQRHRPSLETLYK